MLNQCIFEDFFLHLSTQKMDSGGFSSVFWGFLQALTNKREGKNCQQFSNIYIYTHSSKINDILCLFPPHNEQIGMD